MLKKCLKKGPKHIEYASFFQKMKLFTIHRNQPVETEEQIPFKILKNKLFLVQ
jgi:hypothetical protein